MDLLPKLRTLADVWVTAHHRTDPSVSLKTLGVRSVANAKLFDRPAMVVPTFERVVQYLAEPANWPAAVIPCDAEALLKSLGHGGRIETYGTRAA